MYYKLPLSKIHAIITSPSLKRGMRGISKVKLDYTYDIPYLAGYSNDAQTVYIDRHLDTEFQGQDVSKFLKIHEFTEKLILDIFGLKYQQAHRIATLAELHAVQQAGLDWEEYSAYLSDYIKSCSEEDLQRVPADLDLTPYRDEHDRRILRRIQRANNS